jgi:hypothetical protein
MFRHCSGARRKVTYDDLPVIHAHRLGAYCFGDAQIVQQADLDDVSLAKAEVGGILRVDLDGLQRPVSSSCACALALVELGKR